MLSNLGSVVFGQNQEGEMASKHIVPQQPRGGVVTGKQKIIAADAINRRALEDIGNLVNVRAVEGKPQPQPLISRPITRSSHTQRLENAQTDDAANKKPVVAIADGDVIEKDRANVVKPRATLNPNTQKIIEISPDTGKKFKSTSVEGRNKGKGSSRRKVQTQTSILTHDIDGADIKDQLAVVDYIDDIYKFYKLAETSSRAHDYMHSQSEINERMRAILVDWLIEVHNKFELMPETLYLTLHIVDQYLSREIVKRKELQLVGITAMLIACKYEEIWAPEINDFVCISDKAYSRRQILIMEKAMLNKLEWSLTVPTPYVFIVRFLKAAASDKEMEHLVFYLAELSLMQYSMMKHCPSMIAASAVYAAQSILRKSSTLWSDTLKHHTGFSEPQLLDCSKELVNFHSVAAYSKLRASYKKYSSPQCRAVALLPAATKILSWRS
ncbi:G2/mitotic-specific cyclin S13-7 isoform X1 [Cinnamomum micranthum f. kanehirae]|uniref:G2/mitotic-specific cyclin S13-7 isoform X1 n=1 Tax=Cinnamomum micranthum f. kanehirae TaxID=337451 RepID=A0A3S3ML11_9MAGN|nr:G2/mitotic-specific cyclin S13-7 isoform X1 [Cinnamomum micranthum f. kanehirae]